MFDIILDGEHTFKLFKLAQGAFKDHKSYFASLPVFKDFCIVRGFNSKGCWYFRPFKANESTIIITKSGRDFPNIFKDRSRPVYGYNRKDYKSTMKDYDKLSDHELLTSARIIFGLQLQEEGLVSCVSDKSIIQLLSQSFTLPIDLPLKCIFGKVPAHFPDIESATYFSFFESYTLLRWNFEPLKAPLKKEILYYGEEFKEVVEMFVKQQEFQ